MAKTVQKIIDLAGQQELAADQDTLLQDTYEALSFLQDYCVEVRRRLARFCVYYYTTYKQFTSTTGGADRQVDLATVGSGEYLPVAIRRLALDDDSEIFLVDETRKNEMPAPRAFLRGTMLWEVDSEWGASGALYVNVTYVRESSTLDLDGDYTQNIDLPEDWTRPVVHALTGYIADKDGRKQDAAAWYEKADKHIEALADQLAQMYGVDRQRTEPRG